jgi:dihydrofolate reductase
MRKIILQLAVSLDGFIEGPNGEFDWCFTDADYGMSAFLQRIDAIFLGRKSYELAMTFGGATPPGFPHIREYIFTSSLKEVPGDRVIVSGDLVETVNKIRQEPGKDIWLYGGAALTTSFIQNKLVDEIMLAVHPILLGAGKPLFQNLTSRVPLSLTGSQVYPSGLIMLTYRVNS